MRANQTRRTPGSCRGDATPGPTDPVSRTQATRQTPRTGAQELRVTSLQDFVHSGAGLRGGQSRRGEEVAVQECLSDVCDEVVKDEENKNQC